MYKTGSRKRTIATLLFKGSIILLASGGCFCFKASALGIRVLGQDAEAMARGDAFVATADNPSAIYYNPAGIARLRGNEFLIGAGASWWGRQQTDPYAPRKSVDVHDTFQATPEFYYSFSPKAEGWPSLGLGLYSPFGFSASWPAFPPNALVSGGRLKMEGFLDYQVLSPVVALPVGHGLAIGAGPQFAFSTLQENTDLVDPNNLSIHTHNNGSGTGVGYNVGILWQPHPQHSVAFTYHSPVVVDYSLHQMEGFELPGDPPTRYSRSNDQVLRFPMNVVGGYAFRPNEKWNLEFDVDWTDWSDAKPANWRSSFIYKWGVTRIFENDWRLSAGYSFAENSVPQSRFSRLTPDSDQHLFSVGIGKRFDHWDTTLAYRLGYSVPRSVPATSDNGVYLTHGIDGAVWGVSVGGKYEAISQMLAFSIGFRF